MRKLIKRQQVNNIHFANASKNWNNVAQWPVPNICIWHPIQQYSQCYFEINYSKMQIYIWPNKFHIPYLIKTMCFLHLKSITIKSIRSRSWQLLTPWICFLHHQLLYRMLIITLVGWWEHLQIHIKKSQRSC